MRFFTLQAYDAWARGNNSSIREASVRYRKHLIEMQGVLPRRVLEVADLPFVQDALLVKVRHDRDNHILILALRCGTSSKGYYDLILKYVGAKLSAEHDALLANVARSTISQSYHGCDLAYSELDMSEDGAIEHRFMFHALQWFHPAEGGRICFTIRCRALQWRRVPRRTRRLTAVQDRYPEGPKN